jgi:hypothetical protein
MPECIELDREARRTKLNNRRDLVEKTRQDGKVKSPTASLSWHDARSEFLDQKLFTHSPNPHDIDELEKWEEFRSILDSAGKWEDVLRDGWKTAAGSAAGAAAAGRPSASPLRTGYGCCGAWMVGIKSPAGAPGLAQVLLQEMTSLNFAKKRARMGAGMPARQDFYRYYGDRPVTGMEYLTWSEMLMYLGSTARRRDRIYAAPYVRDKSDQMPTQKIKPINDPAQMHMLIHHALTEIMRVAARTAEDQPGNIIKAAKHFTDKLFDKALGANAPA